MSQLREEYRPYSPKSDIHLPIDGVLEKADFTSDEGAQQGDGLASAGFCVTMRPEVCQLGAELAPHGGAARFDFAARAHTGAASVKRRRTARRLRHTPGHLLDTLLGRIGFGSGAGVDPASVVSQRCSEKRLEP